MPLRLKSLELQGYKTFASRSVFEFASGITAIVGPNGSGKSNIADSLRWVLGEQSYSLLRGKKTEDMIFAGSEHRPRAGMAQATITFDNTDMWLPVDFSEVALERRAYRDGRNDYLLNAQHVRLRDINELLAQAGLSERTYTILGQGLVDASLALKAEDRRRLFEEAAGVGLYRTRREEALRRLENTARNLERVLDIMAELEPRLRSLERQARRAIEYSQAQATLKKILLEWYGYHWHHAQEQLSEARQAVRSEEVRVQEAREAHRKAQEQYISFRERLTELRARLNAWHRQSADLHSQREAASRELAVLEERRRALIASQSSLTGDKERAADELRLAHEHLAEAERDVNQSQQEIDDARGRLTAAEASLRSRQSERVEMDRKLANLRGETEALNIRRSENQARLDDLAKRIESRRGKLETSKPGIMDAESAAKKAEEQHRASKARVEEVEARLTEAETRLEDKKGALERLDAQRRAALDARAKLEAEYSRVRTQREVLEQAEQSLAGYADGARFLLEAVRQSRLAGTRGALSSALDVPAGLETAIAAALGESLDAVLLDGNETESALRLLEAEGAGRAELLPTVPARELQSLTSPGDPDCLGIAMDLIHFSPELRLAVSILLGQVLIVRDRVAARRMIAGLSAPARAVTLRGEVFHADGRIMGGKTARASTLGRPRRIREYDAALNELRASLEESNQAVERLSRELEVARQELAQAEAGAGEARLRVSKSREAEGQAALEFSTARRHLEWQMAQFQQLEQELQEATSTHQALIASQGEIETRLASAHNQLRQFSSMLAGIELEEPQQQSAYWTTRLAVAEQAMNTNRNRLEERQKEVERLEGRQSQLGGRVNETGAALNDLESEKSAFHEQESQLHSQIEAMMVNIEPAEKELETAELEEARLQEAEALAQRSLSNVERSFGQLQLDHTRRQEALTTLRERIVDDFGLVTFDYAANVSGPVPLPLDGMVEELPVVTELSPDVEEQLSQNRAQLRRMGPINPEAKVEFDAESERYEFMKVQVEDLRKAEADLKQVVAELDELTKREFSRTFDAVDKQFRETFVRLFGGGSARLALTDPENLVETGIEIEARLPGRREQGLALLSGGERSLTAIALVFALLKVSPTPVCVMDEVDAMLDEANVGRFRDLLQDLSKDTQFIIITHNRNTVQAADVIYGITMGRDSASQVISLRLDQVTEEMLSKG